MVASGRSSNWPIVPGGVRRRRVDRVVEGAEDRVDAGLEREPVGRAPGEGVAQRERADLGQDAEVRRLQHVEAVPPERDDEIVPGRPDRAPPARADPVEHRGEVERGAPRRLAALDELELVVRAVREEREGAAEQRVRVLRLVVPVAGRDPQLVRGVRRDARQRDREHRVHPAPPHCDEAVAAGDRSLERDAAVEDVELRGAVERVAPLARAEIDGAAQRAPEARREVAREELERLDHVGGDDRGDAAEVEEERDRDAVEVDVRLRGLRAAHDEEADAERAAGDAGQVLEHLQRVTLRAGDGPDLLAPRARGRSPRDAAARRAPRTRTDRSSAARGGTRPPAASPPRSSRPG